MLRKKRTRLLKKHDRKIKQLERELKGEKARINELIKILKRKEYNKEHYKSKKGDKK